jgi:hypothetical protein
MTTKTDPPPYDPTKTLNDLSQQLNEAKSSAQEQNAKAQVLTTAIAALQKSVSEVNSIADAYDAGYDGTNQAQKVLQDYRDQQKKLVDCATKAIEDKLEAASKQVEDQITAAKKKLDDANKKVDDDTREADRAAKDLGTAQAAYDHLKGLLAAVQQKFKKVADLQKNYQAQENLGDAKAMYVYLAAISWLLDNEKEPQLLPKDKFRAKLQDAWTALANAQTALAEEKSELQGSTAARDAAAQFLQTLKDNRIRDKLRKVAPIPEPAGH